MLKYAIMYIILVNAAAFAAYGLDKGKAEKNKWRVPENILMLIVAAGGTIGALSGMLVFHHKTRKPKFVIGIPAILLVQVTALIALLYMIF